MLYGGETWSVNRETKMRLEAPEMCFNRRKISIAWVVRRKNQEILLMAGATKELMNVLRGRQLG